MSRRRFLNGVAFTVGLSGGTGHLAGLRALATHATTITLTGNYGYNKYSVSSLASGTIIDATKASWTLQNSRNSNPTDAADCDVGTDPINRYPVVITNCDDVSAVGGTINGEVPQDSEWRPTYCNSVGVVFKDCFGATLRDWRMDKVWDAVRMEGDGDAFFIDHCHFSDVRDDAVANIRRQGGRVRNCLIDGTFVGFSQVHDSINAPDKELVIEGTLLRMKQNWFEGKFTHASFFKMNSDIADAPAIRLRNNVFAITHADHAERHRLERGWNRVVESSGNYFLNLTDDPLPADYPNKFGSLGGGEWVGFTVLHGQEARDFWETAKAAWLSGGEVPVSTEPEP